MSAQGPGSHRRFCPYDISRKKIETYLVEILGFDYYRTDGVDVAPEMERN